MSARTPNSHECAYGGYKLSNIDPKIEASSWSELDLLSIGTNEDDTYYANSGKSGRVKIEVNDCALDLEDVLVFARKYCNGIYVRVMREVTEHPE